MNRMVRVLLAVVLVCALRADARACSISPPRTHVVDPSMQATDQTPPTLPPVTVLHITRGTGGDQCGFSHGTCDANGVIALSAPATDNVTAATSIGYRYTLEAGSLPQDFALPTDAREPYGDEIFLRWTDGDTNSQESIDFTVRVVAIDLAGNESAPQSVRVIDDRGGCAIARGGGSRSARGWIVLALLVLAARRRRLRARAR